MCLYCVQILSGINWLQYVLLGHILILQLRQKYY